MGSAVISLGNGGPDVPGSWPGGTVHGGTLMLGAAGAPHGSNNGVSGAGLSETALARLADAGLTASSFQAVLARLAARYLGSRRRRYYCPREPNPAWPKRGLGPGHWQSTHCPFRPWDLVPILERRSMVETASCCCMHGSRTSAGRHHHDLRAPQFLAWLHGMILSIPLFFYIFFLIQ